MRRVLTRVLLGLLVVASVAAAWFGWLLWQVYDDLDEAGRAATTLQESLTDGDESATRSAADELSDRSRSAQDLTEGTSWSLLTHLPVVGDDARGVRLASQVLSTLSTDGLEPIIDSAADLQSLAPRDGSVPLDRIEALQEPVARSKAVFDRADETLGAQDTTGYTGRLRRQYRSLAALVDSASRALDTADKAVRLMPDMLGRDGVRRYLLVFQNNAEVRSTGGLPGSVALIEARDGAVSMERQVTGASFGETRQPALPLTDSELETYGRQLGTYFLDAGFTPDFPRAADLWSAHWQRRFDQEVDGVFAVDPVALSYVLGATGPLDVGQEVPLDESNAVEALLNTAYLVFPTQAQQDAFFEASARTIFETFTAGGAPPAELLGAVARGVEEHRVLAHSTDPEEQAVLSGSDIAGEMVSDPDDPSPQVGVYLNDNTGSKMSFYLRTEVSVAATFCRDGVQGVNGTATLGSVAPPGLPATITGGGLYGIPEGSQLVALRLYAPVDGSVTDVEFDRVPIDDVQLTEHDGRQVATTYVFLDPGQSVRVTWRMVSGPGQTGDVDVDVTPGVAPVGTSSVESGSC